MVKVGISLFNEILLQNGYLEYQEDSNNYQITQATICYFCGKRHGEHKSIMKLSQNSDSDSEYDIDRIQSEPIIEALRKSDSSSEYEHEKEGTEIPMHAFYPATFITITGTSGEETRRLSTRLSMRKSQGKS